MARRISIALLVIALFWVGEPAFALWSSASEHTCCLPKPVMPSCHGMAHRADGATLASHHQHSDCPHDCCTRLRMGATLAATGHVAFQELVRTGTFAPQIRSEVRATAIYAVSFERAPPSLS